MSTNSDNIHLSPLVGYNDSIEVVSNTDELQTNDGDDHFSSFNDIDNYDFPLDVAKAFHDIGYIWTDDSLVSFRSIPGYTFDPTSAECFLFNFH